MGERECTKGVFFFLPRHLYLSLSHTLCVCVCVHLSLYLSACFLSVLWL